MTDSEVPHITDGDNEGGLGGMLQHQMDQYRAQVSADKPKLRITRYTSSHSNEASYLGITIPHELADGSGGLKLINAILMPSTHTLTAETCRPRRLEDTVDLRAPTYKMLGIIFRKLLLPKLPTVISSFFPEDEIWPGTAVSKSPIECRNGLQVLSLTVELIDKLSSERTKHNPAPSIHAVIKTIYTLALISVIQPPDIGRPAMTFKADTPRSVRQADLGHPYCLGNYLSALSFSFTPELLQRHAASFWDLAGEAGAHLKSPEEWQNGLHEVGMLAHVPNGPTVGESTAWSQFFRSQAERPAPYNASLELSNLGTLMLPPGAKDMAWAQPGSLWGAVITVSMLRHGGGARLCVTWREGCAVDNAVIRRINGVFIMALERVADGWEGSAADLVMS